MEINGKQTIPAPRSVVWDALNDPDVLQKCLPGCESVERVSPEEFRVLVAAAIGPLRARFKGTLRLTEAIPPASCIMVFEGQGGAMGFGKGSSSVSLVETLEGTELSYSASAQVGGKLAQVGSRLIDNVARKMSDDFFVAFKGRFPGAEQPQAVAEPVALPVLAGADVTTVVPVTTVAPVTPVTVAPATAASGSRPSAPAIQRPAATRAPAEAMAQTYLVPAWWMGVAALVGASIAIAAANLIR
jgi:carbon monoxide dehydrogenase subunit G